MTDFLLFIDTEASGLPKTWELPYSAKNNWPYCVQVSWIIYTKDGEKVKYEDHFIKEDDFKIEHSATKVHGITQPFLKINGKSRQQVMQLLHNDVSKYNPLIIGHFMEFDFHMIGVDFYRCKIENPLKKEMTFCTMLATTHLVKNPVLRFYRLGELYESLFHSVLKNQHNALVDAHATSECFFELIKLGEIDDDIIINQQKEISRPKPENKGVGCIIPVLIIICLFFLTFYYYG